MLNDALNYNATDDTECREILSFFIVWKTFEILKYSNNFIEKLPRERGIKIQIAIEVNITSRDFEREERDARF